MSWIERHGFTFFRTFNLTQLGVDEAWVNVTNLASESLWLYQLSLDCHECPYKLRKDLSLSPGTSKQFKISTKFPLSYRFRTDDEPEYVLGKDDSTFCEMEATFGEFGVYDLIANKDGICILDTLLNPVNIYLPLVVALIFYGLLTMFIILWGKYGGTILNRVGQRILKTSTPSRPETSLDKDKIEAPTKQRLRSLDTFRGVCILLMIMVNDGGAGYNFLNHATWDGLTLGDTIFPWFLWIMGVCIPVSIKSQLRKKIPKPKIFQGIVIRSLKLIGIGLILASRRGPVNIETFRLPGVLQRFGVCYFATASLMLLSGSEDFLINRFHSHKILRIFQDITFIWKGWAIALIILLVHTLLTFFLPVPGCPTGYLGPGGLHLYGKLSSYPSPASCIGGAAGYIDTQILTPSHIFLFPTALSTYSSAPYDPEGILGTLTSIFQVWLGVQAGMTLQVFLNPVDRLVRWSVWAVISGGVGAALCGAQQTGGFIPVNKNLWSLSFVLVTTSLALTLLIVLYTVIDLRKWWTGSPFYEPGMNSILLYVGHSVGFVALPWHFRYKDAFVGSHFVGLVESLWGTSVWVGIAMYLCRIEYFWTV